MPPRHSGNERIRFATPIVVPSSSEDATKRAKFVEVNFVLAMMQIIRVHPHQCHDALISDRKGRGFLITLGSQSDLTRAW
ncbi:hypothetical protein MCOR14_012133 [Pyricularia oryzae]|nr:hypothetical protein MCOR22_011786 [Pyricularia oryzae]KAI6641639.1 hypothetical protein MCOR14_012133 [Pyricularia oryzae]